MKAGGITTIRGVCNSTHTEKSFRTTRRRVQQQQLMRAIRYTLDCFKELEQEVDLAAFFFEDITVYIFMGRFLWENACIIFQD